MNDENYAAQQQACWNQFKSLQTQRELRWAIQQIPLVTEIA